MGVLAGRGAREGTAKLQYCVTGTKQLLPVLELRRPRGRRARERVLLPAVPRAAAPRPLSGLLQPHGLVRAAASGSGPGQDVRDCRAREQGQPGLGRRSNRSFRVDTMKLQHRYQQLQRLVHPDFFSQRSQMEKDFSEKHSTLVNDAYKTLLAPLSRGLYLLKLRGIEIHEGTDNEMDREFLMEIMEINEKLAEAQSEAATKEIESVVRAKQKEYTDNVSRAFEQDDFEKAKEILTKMKYFSNVEEKIKLKKIPL
ncbi:iron-sulfur cluster co-chaperone protein HscB isoform X1 [Choloepus didactylus]|uniref:iron-sulfur cluster co-chaperone protein HscB isoform X1 n=2 Tax=Choloepus didactylus TaxID=27675 RepID=UPI00189FE859|nr:iron-sulfur cluster co-chaperone protein HscB isoform X1 [Choloepus didactylus]